MILIRRVSFFFFFLGAIILSAFQTDLRTFNQVAMQAYADDPTFARYLELNVKPVSIWDRIMWWLQRLWGEFWSDPLRADLTWFLVALILLAIGVFYFLKLGYNKAVVASSPKQSSVLDLVPEASENFDIRMDDALKSRDYRMAIRFLYLKCLLKLSERSLIRFQDWKTPLDYQMELPNRGQEAYRNLASLFEHSWYGDFEVNRSDYDKGNNYAEMLDELEK